MNKPKLGAGCRECGGTGEGWLDVSGGDGWSGKPCPHCVDADDQQSEVSTWNIYTSAGVNTGHQFASPADAGEDEGVAELKGHFETACQMAGIDAAEHNYCIAATS